MYSWTSPFFKVKFWKKELVGKGEERRSGAKKRDGSGRTVDVAAGKRNCEVCGGDMGDGGNGCGGCGCV